jgi:hypothetical protein
MEAGGHLDFDNDHDGWQDLSAPSIVEKYSVLSKRRSGVDISNGSKVIAFSKVGLQEFKMAAGDQNGGTFSTSLGRSISIVKSYVFANVNV